MLVFWLVVLLVNVGGYDIVGLDCYVVKCSRDGMCVYGIVVFVVLFYLYCVSGRIG